MVTGLKIVLHWLCWGIDDGDNRFQNVLSCYFPYKLDKSRASSFIDCILNCNATFNLSKFQLQSNGMDKVLNIVVYAHVCLYR